MSKLDHFSHEHSLVLSEERNEFFFCCGACGCEILGLSYCCEECRYALHKWCADLPYELTQHQLHPNHLLLLEFPKHNYWEALSKREDSHEEEEEEDSFEDSHEENEEEDPSEDSHEEEDEEDSFEDSHEEEDSKKKDSSSSEEEEEEEEEDNSHDEEEEKKEDIFCKSCNDRIVSDFYYRCVQCSFNLHADCAWLPKQLMLEYGTKAYLTFKHMEVDHSSSWSYTCKFCKKSGQGSRFVADIKYPANELDVIDDEPNEIDKGSWHIQCAMLPYTVKHERHLHNLTIHPPIEKDLNYDECYCDNCEQDRDPNDWIYYCESCEFAAHIGCGIAGLDRPKQLILSTHPVYVDLKLMKEMERILPDGEDYIEMEEERRKERILEDRKGLEELQHFHHEHPLILYDEKWNEKIFCHACHEPIFGNTYICNDCEFYMHQWCAKLPRKIHHRLHSQHPLILVPWDRMEFLCNYCKISSYGFSFSCKKCHFNLHTKCVVLPENPIHHESHKHPLTPVNHVTDWAICKACNEMCPGPVLKCDRCHDFSLYWVYALYPPTGRAKTHRHGLVIDYSYDEDPDALEFICDACEKPRNPYRWLYRCPDAKCNFVAHVDCAVPNLFDDFAKLGFDQFFF